MCSVAIALALVGLIAFLPAIPYLFVAVSWVSAALEWDLHSSSSLAVIAPRRRLSLGPQCLTLNLYDALDSAIFVGITGSIFQALNSTGNLALDLRSRRVIDVHRCAAGGPHLSRIGVVLSMSSLHCADRSVAFPKQPYLGTDRDEVCEEASTPATTSRTS